MYHRMDNSYNAIRKKSKIPTPLQYIVTWIPKTQVFMTKKLPTYPHYLWETQKDE